MAAEILEAVKKTDESRFQYASEADIVLISKAINAVIAKRILKGERVQLNGIGNLYLEVNEWTRRHVPGQGIVRVPKRYNVDFNPSSVLERGFAGLPALEGEAQNGEEEGTAEPVPPLPESPTGWDTSVATEENPESPANEEPPQSDETVFPTGEPVAPILSPDDPGGVNNPFPGYVPPVPTETFEGALTEALKKETEAESKGAKKPKK